VAKVLLDPSKATSMMYAGASTFVTCKDGDRDNIITITWQSSFCPAPAIVGISVTPKRFSYDMIKNAGEYVINIPNKELLWELHYCGYMSGRDVDKFKETGLTREPAHILKTPMIKECIANIECKICNVYPIADGLYSIFVAEVVAAHADDRYFDGSFWKTGETGGAELLHYLGGTKYAKLGETVDFKDAVKKAKA